MPYAIAHPVAVIPLCRALGRRAVPSALAIGSVIPDAWYLVPGLDRPFSHNASGLLLFCLPAGLLAYVLFHALLKEPLLQLFPFHLSSRLRAFACRGFPKRSPAWVALNLVLGAMTHVAWDALTHRGRLSRAFPEIFSEDVLRVLQHASTVLAGAFLLWWLSRKLREARPVETPILPARIRIFVVAALLLVAVLAALLALPDPAELRQAARSAAAAGGSALLAALVAYAAAFLWMRR